MQRAIQLFLEAHQGPIWLIPHTYAEADDVESDNAAIEELMNHFDPSLRARMVSLDGAYSAQELKWIIGRCEMFMGGRMHSCIAALSQGVPCIGVAYSKKFAGVFGSVGMGDWVIDARRVALDDALQRTRRLYQQRDGVRPLLLSKSREAAADLEHVFAEIVCRNEQHPQVRLSCATVS